MDEAVEKEFEVTYAPSALLNLFNNSLNVAASRKMVQVKGIYLPGKGANYSGYYYDSLRDEASDATLTLVVPALIRDQLTPNKTIHFLGYITRRVVTNGGRIELHINLSELLGQTQNKFSEEDIQKLELQQEKSRLGYRDVTSFIKQRIISEERLRIAIMVGKTAIIDQDIKHQLEEAIVVYDISYHRVNFTSEPAIIEAITSLNNSNVDVLVIARGGGENIQLFEKPSIAASCIKLHPYLVTAIGHKDDTPLLQKIADKAFITPTALGQFLNDLYNETVGELQQSKAKLVDDITKTLQANYEQQIKNLQEQIQNIEKQKQAQIQDLNQLSQNTRLQSEEIHKKQLALLESSIQALKEQKQDKERVIEDFKRRLDAAKSARRGTWKAVLIALAIGLILGLILANSLNTSSIFLYHIKGKNSHTKQGL